MTVSSFVAQTMFAYDRQSPEEASLLEGQIVNVIEENDAGWWLIVDLNSSATLGWAPSNFLRRVDPEEVLSALPAAVAGSTSPSTNSAIPPTAADNQKLQNSKKASGPMASSERCHQCHEPLDGSFVLAAGNQYHSACFQCDTCSQPLAGQLFVEKEGRNYCEVDYLRQFGVKCAKCDQVIRGTYTTAFNKTWHPEHFTCHQCSQPFESGSYREGPDGHPYCESDFQELFGPKCSCCSKAISGTVFSIRDLKFHLECFVCDHDQAPIAASDPFHERDGKFYCVPHFQNLHLERCSSCQQFIDGAFAKVMQRSYHQRCFKCESCQADLMKAEFTLVNAQLLCMDCKLKSGGEAEPVQPKPDLSTRADVTVKSITSNLPATHPRSSAIPLEPDQVKKASLEPDQVKKAPLEPEQVKKAPSPSLEKFPNSSESPTLAQGDKSWEHGVAPNLSADQMRQCRELPAKFDVAHKEAYLSNEEFLSIFNMNRTKFYELKQWKQQDLKQKVQLF